MERTIYSLVRKDQIEISYLMYMHTNFQKHRDRIEVKAVFICEDQGR